MKQLNIFNTSTEVLRDTDRSYTSIPNSIIRNSSIKKNNKKLRRLTDVEFRIMMVMLASDPAIEATIATMVRFTGISRKRINKALPTLIEDGYILQVEHTRTGNKRWDFTYVYTDTPGVFDVLNTLHKDTSVSNPGIAKAASRQNTIAQLRLAKSDIPIKKTSLIMTVPKADNKDYVQPTASFIKNPAPAGIKSPQKSGNSIETIVPLFKEIKTSSKDTLLDLPDNYKYHVGRLSTQIPVGPVSKQHVRAVWNSYKDYKHTMVELGGGDYQESEIVPENRVFFKLYKKMQGTKTTELCLILNALIYYIRENGNTCFADMYGNPAAPGQHTERRQCILKEFDKPFGIISNLNRANELEKKLPALLKLLHEGAFDEIAAGPLAPYVSKRKQNKAIIQNGTDNFPKPPQ